MTSRMSVSALFFDRINNNLSNYRTPYFDDTPYARNLKCAQLKNLTEAKYRFKLIERQNIQIVGVQSNNTNLRFELPQSSYIANLREVWEERNYYIYNAQRSRIA